MRRNVLASVVLAAALLAPAMAHAQRYSGGPGPGPGPGYGPPPPETPLGITDHLGLALGISLGGGGYYCSNCTDKSSNDGLSLTVHGGWFFTQRFALVLEGFVVSHPYQDGTSLDSITGTVGVQYYLAKNLWVRGGIGYGNLQFNYNDGGPPDQSEDGGSIALAGGLEIIQAPHWSLDVELHFGETAYSDINVVQSAVTVGFNWF